MNNLKKLHLGCGEVRFPDWLNIDLDTPSADMNLDLTHPLPFTDGSVTHIFNEHFIEHITRPQAVSFLGECRRILSPNGVIRITTPSLRFLTASYFAGNKEEWGELWQPDTNCLLINEGMRSWGHQFVYDADELVRILIEAGFNSISFQEYRKSKDKTLCGLESRPFHNELIIEARSAENTIPEIDHLKLNENENLWSAKLGTEQSTRFLIAEQTISDQAHRIRAVESEASARSQHIAGLEKTISDQAHHIHAVESEVSARSQHITGLEKTISDQAHHIRAVESELTVRAQNIAELAQVNEHQASILLAKESEMSANNQKIALLEQTLAQQTRQISALSIALAKFQNSLYGKCLSGASRLISLIKNK